MPLGDVLADAAQAAVAAFSVAERVGARVHPPDGAVGPDHAVLERHPPSGRDRAPDLSDQRGTIGRVHRSQVIGQHATELHRRDPVDSVHLGRPLDRVGLFVPHPAADVGKGLAFAEAGLALGQGRLRNLLLGHVPDDRRHTDDDPGGVENRRQGDRYGHVHAVAPACHRLQPVHPFTGEHAVRGSEPPRRSGAARTASGPAGRSRRRRGCRTGARRRGSSW